MPPRSRAPISAELMAAISCYMMLQGEREMAIMVAALFFSYCGRV